MYESRIYMAVAAGIFLSIISTPVKADDRTLIGQSGHFHFYSDIRLNLHDYIFGLAQTGNQVPEGIRACIDNSSPEDRDGWEVAFSHYQETMGERHPRRDPLMRAVRILTTGQTVPQEIATELSQLLDIISLARPVYERCLWSLHDERNRAKAEEILGLIQLYGAQISKAISNYFRTPWPPVIVVDLVQYSNNVGANTMGGANIESHISFANNNPVGLDDLPTAMKGLVSLEILYHEASHELFSAGFGIITEKIDEASERKGGRAPFNLSHAISFYTSGYVMQAVLPASENYVPYWQITGLMARAWPQYLEAIEEFWRPYLDGETDLEQAIDNIVSAVIQVEFND